jgi:ribonuclease R
MKKHHPRGSSNTSLGIVKRHPDGFGFFISDDSEQPDIYIPRQGMNGVMTNDRVRVRFERERGGDRFRGEVEEILQRSVTRAMGQYKSKGPGRGVLFDKSFAWGEDLTVSCPPDITARDGELVVAQIEDYPGSIRGFSGRVISVIGDAADPLNDSVRMLHAHNIPHEFSRAAVREADALSPEVSEKDWAGRRDLRHLPIITIDGKTAKDFDDAIFTESTAGGFHLIVAIADVSHYVREGSAIDADAYLRGTSTYFPGFVSPMLPEKLSNELCSLKPHVPRLALVADMHLNFQGDLERSEFYEGVILSHARVTYGEAQQVLEGATPEAFRHVEANIRKSADLAKILMNKRFREGSLDLELPETTIEVDEAGQPVDIMQSERLFAHRLIEELMLTANVAVARFFKEKQVDALYRIHEEPNPDAMKNFASFLKIFGFKEKLSGGHLQKKISKALEHFKNHPKAHVLNMLALRSLAQAKYSPNNVGHFGLGFMDYTHFTSPIRRYPDLIVHRLVKSVLYPEKGYRRMSLADLESAGTVLSACEQRSVKAERQIHAIKKARFMSQHVGEEFEGLINSVTRFGVFVLLRQFDIDGLLRLEELGGDRFEFDEEKMRLVGKKSGMAYEIGDLLRVVIAKADVELGQIDFVMAGRKPTAKPQYQETRAHVGKAKQPFSKRRSSKDDSRSSRKSRVSRPRRSR